MESGANQPTDGSQPPWMFKQNMHKVMDDWKDRRANEGRPVARDELHGMKAFWKSKLKEAQVEYPDQKYLQLYYAEGRTWMHYGNHANLDGFRPRPIPLTPQQIAERKKSKEVSAKDQVGGSTANTSGYGSASGPDAAKEPAKAGSPSEQKIHENAKRALEMAKREYAKLRSGLLGQKSRSLTSGMVSAADKLSLYLREQYGLRHVGKWDDWAGLPFKKRRITEDGARYANVLNTDWHAGELKWIDDSFRELVGLAWYRKLARMHNPQESEVWVDKEADRLRMADWKSAELTDDEIIALLAAENMIGYHDEQVKKQKEKVVFSRTMDGLGEELKKLSIDDLGATDSNSDGKEADEQQRPVKRKFDESEGSNFDTHSNIPSAIEQRPKKARCNAAGLMSPDGDTSKPFKSEETAGRYPAHVPGGSDLGLRRSNSRMNRMRWTRRSRRASRPRSKPRVQSRSRKSHKTSRQLDLSHSVTTQTRSKTMAVVDDTGEKRLSLRQWLLSPATSKSMRRG